MMSPKAQYVLIVGLFAILVIILGIVAALV
jgi:hypothetical protein